MKKELLLVGHRGAKASEPENTLKGFKAGIKAGADAIEFDTRLTKDEKLVVIHDKTLDRTTDGKGKVSEHSLAQIRKLDAGGGEKVPTPKEALDFIIKKKGKVALMEVKDRASAERIGRLAKKYKSKVIVHAWDADILKRLHAVDKDLQTALIINHDIKNMTGFFRMLKAVHASWVFAEKDVIDKEFVEMAHKYKVKVQAWVCNTLKDMRRFIKLGADCIASDKPELFKKL